MAVEKPSSKGQAWFCATGLPSDIVVEVHDMTFHLHKFPLMSKSRKLDQLIAEQAQKSSIATVTKQKRSQTETEIQEEEEEEHHEEQGDGEEEEVQYQISLPDFPGGSETFETAAKFCYGVKIDISSSTVVPLRCAAEFLEMTDEYSEDNLISKTERFLSQSVFRSLKESIKALKSCESVMSLAESLGIVERLIDSIASRASSTDPTLFGWPVNEGISEAKGASSQALWNGIETGLRRKTVARTNNVEPWFENLSLLSLPLFKRLILTLKTRDLSPEIIESCLMCYAKKYIPGTSRSNRKPSTSSASVVSESEQRELLETIISNLPLEQSPLRSSTATRFLFGLLRTANILNASESSKAALEKKIGLQLEQATLDDLLIPSYSYLNETLYDVDCVERILGYFLDGLEERNTAETGDNNNNIVNINDRPPVLMLVGKLIDGYLSEIASDANLKPEKFHNLAISLPDQARNFDDGLYRAVDVYLKAHPWVPESEREKLCGVLDCQKLTLEACTHAAQNERLPLRAVVQVLFFEQLQLRHAIAGTLLAAEEAPVNAGRLSETARREEEVDEGDEEERAGAAVSASRGEPGSSTWRAAVRENQVLRLDMDSMRTRVHQLERECSTMKRVIQKIENDGPRGGGWRGSLNRRFGCKLKTQVCDSHESTVAETQRGRHHHQSHQHHPQ
ncbi:hypothetical protein PTKIN_Ptkin07bG0283900 [Pterospermum kingtungense]